MSKEQLILAEGLPERNEYYRELEKDHAELLAIVETLYLGEAGTTLKSDCWQLAHKYLSRTGSK